MAIITFKSNDLKETGQTLSLAAIATQFSIEHNYKTLLISTSFRDRTLGNCFWDLHKPDLINVVPKGQVGVQSGIEGLVKVLISNRTTPEIVKNYSKIVLRDRLDVLLSPSAQEYKEYANIANSYPEVLQIANRYYDIVLVDLSSRLPKEVSETIIHMSDIIMINMSQRLKNIDEYLELKENDEFYKKNNIMLLMGRYDAFSKYNVKNITRYLREKKPINAIPYNTLFFEACSEGKIVDFFLKLKSVTDETDRNYLFLKETTKAANSIIYKLQELQINI